MEVEEIKLDAYEEELVVYAEEISHYLQKSGANQQEAKDIAQDVLLKMLESDFLLPQEKMRSWMYRVALRKYIDYYRRKKRYQDIVTTEFLSNQIQYDQTCDYDNLYQALEELPQNYRLVIDLYYFNDFSVKEIASILEVSQSKVKIDLWRGRKKMKELLERDGIKHDPIK